MGPVTGPRRDGPRCAYGVKPALCGAPATTKRQRPNGGELWDVCERHAAFLDRLRANIVEHSVLLARLADE